MKLYDEIEQKDYQAALDIVADRKFDKVGKEAIKDLQECVNIVMPRLIEKYDRKIDEAITVVEYFCPNCKRIMKDYRNYCDHCGQHIKWS